MTDARNLRTALDYTALSLPVSQGHARNICMAENISVAGVRNIAPLAHGSGAYLKYPYGRECLYADAKAEAEAEAEAEP